MRPYDPRLKKRLNRVRFVGGGGGWLNKPIGALLWVDEGLKLLGELSNRNSARVLVIPTPADQDNTFEEVGPLRDLLNEREFVTCQIAGEDGTWPTRKQLKKGLKWANVVVISGGNTAELLRRIGPNADLLIKKFFSGEAVFVGSSAGTLLWFERAFTATVPDIKAVTSDDFLCAVYALGALPWTGCVHFGEVSSKTGMIIGAEFQEYLAGEPAGSLGIGIPAQCAIVLNLGEFYVISRDPSYAAVQLIVVGEQPNKRRQYRDRLHCIKMKSSATHLKIRDLFRLAA